MKLDSDIFAYPIRWIPKALTLKNYVYVLYKTLFPIYVLNSLYVCLSTVVVTIALGTFAAYGFSRFNWPGRDQLLLSFIILQMIPPVLNIIPLWRMMNRLGLINTRTALIIIYGASNIPIAVWFMKAYIDGLPQELDDAARIDGCSHIGTFVRVILPLCKHGLVTIAVLVFQASWVEFILALILISNDRLQTVTLGLYNFVGPYGQANWGPLTAACILAMLPTLFFFLFVVKYYVKGLSTGAIK